MRKWQKSNLLNEFWNIHYRKCFVYASMTRESSYLNAILIARVAISATRLHQTVFLTLPLLRCQCFRFPRGIWGELARWAVGKSLCSRKSLDAATQTLKPLLLAGGKLSYYSDVKGNKKSSGARVCACVNSLREAQTQSTRNFNWNRTRLSLPLWKKFFHPIRWNCRSFSPWKFSKWNSIHVIKATKSDVWLHFTRSLRVENLINSWLNIS